MEEHDSQRKRYICTAQCNFFVVDGFVSRGDAVKNNDTV